MLLEYDELTLSEKRYYEKIYFAILNGEDSVSLFGLFKMEILEKIVTVLKYDHAELFYVDFRRINCVISPVGMIYHICYMVSLAVLDNMNCNMEKWIVAAINQLQLVGDETEEDIYRKVHNYLIRNVEYDYEALENPDMYMESFTICGVFKYKKAVCEGISKAFKLLCNRIGVKEVYIVEGTSSQEGFGDSIPHVWNIVKSNNKYSHIDVTWDLGLSQICRYNRYDYFMIPDDWIRLDHIYISKFNCEMIEQSYFFQQDCLISGINELKVFLEQKLQNNFSIIYFKVIAEGNLPNDIDNKVDITVQRIIQQYIKRTYHIEMVPNQAQHIYFYKINDRW